MQENRLAAESSPYLLQHKNNPVDWYPWGDEAFTKAAKEDKPIFLSIGYSTCHWCHVMEHESFEDQEVADYLNENYVSIKVDREERPDIDHIYMTVCQMITGSGGWPLTVVMTPDKKPFFAGTYFPKTTRGNRIGLLELTQKLTEVWKNKRDVVSKSADEITGYLNTQEFAPGEMLDTNTFENAFKHFQQSYDNVFGGFGSSPKFPTPHNLLFLMRYYKFTGNQQSLDMVEKTLLSMRSGGIFDQIGFGFHRYSTDKEWLVPHFEKMLYDQALLILAYTEAFQITGKSVFKQTVLEIAEYVLRDLTSENGGFYSAEDADSEGVEGKFYVWEESEIKQLIDSKKANLITKYFNIKSGGNFRNEVTGEYTGQNIPHLKLKFSDLANESGESTEEIAAEIKLASDILFDYRCGRIRPQRDDKILTDWNGLMIAALAKAGRTFGNTFLIESAEKAAQFVLDNLYDPKTRILFHRYREGSGGIDANLDDYAFLIWGLLELYQADFDNNYLITAINLNSELDTKFRDAKSGGYYFSPENKKDLIARKKILYDGAIPSGNSVMLHNLFNLYLVTGEVNYIINAEKLEKSFSQTVENTPFLYSHFLSGAMSKMNMGKLVIVTGSLDNKKNQLERLNRIYNPDMFIVNINERNKAITKKIPYLKNYPVEKNKVKFYVCKNGECSLPTENIDEVIKLLDQN